MRPFDDIDLHAFVDGQVGTNRRDAIEAYLKQSPEDQQRVARWQGQATAIRTAFAGAASEPVPLWLTVGQIAAEKNHPASPPSGHPPESRPQTRARSVSLPSGLLMFGVAVLAFGGGLAVAKLPVPSHVLPAWIVGRPGLSPRQAFERRALEAHTTFATDPDAPVDMADVPPGNVKRWLERRVSFPVVVPDLGREGWTLRGGRLAPAEHGAGALLVYENGLGERLSLFSARADFKADPTATAEDNGILFWADGQVGTAVLTTRGPNWLERNAPAIEQVVQRAALDE